MWDFEHPPEMERLAARYEVHRSMPAECADELARGTADIGLIPIAAYATIPDLVVLPGCTIASANRVRSILMVVKHPDGIRGVRRVAADIDSRTSNAYAQIIFHKFYNRDPEFIPHAPYLDAMLAECDATILIGDPALLALEDQAARFARTGERLEYIDLAAEWKRHTGTNWVSAFWAARPDAIRQSGVPTEEIASDFVRSRDHGMENVDALVREWSPRLPIPPETIRAYLTQNIHYVLDPDCLKGIDLFFRYAAETGVLPVAPELRILE
jgi:chorismate dehydratase